MVSGTSRWKAVLAGHDVKQLWYDSCGGMVGRCSLNSLTHRQNVQDLAQVFDETSR